MTSLAAFRHPWPSSCIVLLVIAWNLCNEKGDALAADNAGPRNYIAAHRVRPESGAAAATRNARTADHLSATVAAGSADAFVAPSQAGLVTCDALYQYALPAHQWAKDLIGKGLAALPDRWWIANHAGKPRHPMDGGVFGAAAAN